MSNFNNASLIVTPNSKKAGKLYSLKGADLDVVRATTATYVGSDGLIKTALANVPRLDYTNGSCPSILVEPQRTNLVLRSEEFVNNTSWFNSNATINQNTTISPSGVQDADTITVTSISNLVAQTITVTASTTYTLSFYVLRGSMTNLKYSVYNLSGASEIIAPTSYYSQTSASSWVRVSATFTTPVGCTSINIYPIRDTGVTGTVFLWGAQLEVGSNATSYIPTVASTVTRNADLISKTGISSLIGQTEGTIYVEANLQGISFSDNIPLPLISISLNSTTQNRIEIYRANNVIQYDNIVGGAVQFAAPVFTITNFTGKIKIALSYKLNNVKVFVNGSLRNTDTTALIPTCNNLYIGRLGFDSTRYWSSGINASLLFQTQLIDAQCISLTTL